jgi:hypothetical protein
MDNLPATQGLDEKLISDIAMDIGKEMVARIEMMYPDVYDAMNSGCKLSIRNGIHNDIMWAIKQRSEHEYREWIATRQVFRRKQLKAYRSFRTAPSLNTKEGK